MSYDETAATILSALFGGRASLMPKKDVSYLDMVLLDESGLVKILPASALATIQQGDMALWCHWRSVYGLPTVELVDWLKARIGDRKAIEIGAGNGALGRALGVPRTDSRMQERPEIIEYYTRAGQNVIRYPDDIEKLDAPEAIAKYAPDVVIGSWITHLYREDEHDRGGNMFGVDEDALLDTGVTYIHVGATTSHDKKRILSRKHEVFRFDWLAGRGEPQDRAIWVWEGQK